MSAPLFMNRRVIWFNGQIVRSRRRVDRHQLSGMPLPIAG
jgi:hypothetical protein